MMLPLTNIEVKEAIEEDSKNDKKESSLYK